MIDHATLSASQEQQGLKISKHRKNPAVVSDLSASIENWHKNMLSLNEAIEDSLEISASLVLAKLLSTRQSWQGIKAASFLFFTGLLPLLEQRFTLRERDEVLSLLQKYPLLSLYLLEIYEQIGTYFPHAHFFLEAIREPETMSDDLEIGTSNDNLIISVVTRIRPHQAVENLKQFYKNWWLSAPDKANIKEMISFNLECI